MSNFAKIDENNVVTAVMVAEQDFIDTGLVGDSSLWVQTSNAAIGGTYDKVNDVFIEPQPFSSWTLDSDHDWQAPTAKPDDGKEYYWEESSQSWKEYSMAGSPSPRSQSYQPHYRASSYPKLEEQFDLLWHAIDAGTLDKTSDFYIKLKKVKDDYPKPD
jgi:hypothetical protein